MSSASAHSQQSQHQNRRRSVFVIIASYSLFTLGWILLSDYLLDSAGLPVAQLFWFGLAKGLIYIVLSALLLYFLVQRTLDKSLELPSLKVARVKHARILWLLLLILLSSPVLSLLVKNLYGEQVLAATRDSSVRVLSQKQQFFRQWLQERQFDINSLRHDLGLAQQLTLYVKQQQKDALVYIGARLSPLVASHAFSQVELYAADKQLFSVGHSVTPPKWAHSEQPELWCADRVSFRDCRLIWQLYWPQLPDVQIRLQSRLDDFVLPELLSWPDSGVQVSAVLQHQLHQSGQDELVLDQRLWQELVLKVRINKDEVLAPVRTLVTWVSLVSLVLFTVLSVSLLLYWRQLMLAYMLTLQARQHERSSVQKAFFSSPFVGMAIVRFADLVLLQSNQRLEQMTLKNSAQLSELPLRQLLQVDDWLAFVKALRDLPRDNFHLTWQATLIRPSVPALLVELSIYALQSDSDTEPVLLLSVEDITERQLYKKNLRRRAQLMATLASVSQQFLQNSDWLAVFRQNLPALADHMQVGTVFLYQCQHHSSGTEAWRLAIWRAHQEQVKQDLVHLNQEMLSQVNIASVLAKGEILAGPITDFSPETQQLLSQNGVQGLAILPVMSGDLWWGFIGFTTHQVDYHWSQSELDTLKLLSDTLGNAIKRQQFENSLQQAAVVFDSTREGIMVTDANNNILQVNQSLLDMLGYEQHEVLGQSPAMFSSGRHDSSFYLQMWQELQQSGHWQGEIWNRRKNGEIYPELLSISAIYDHQQQIKNYVAVFADITQLKASQQELEYLAHHDVLTGLPNRLKMLSRLDGAIDAAMRHQQRFALMMLDLDRFKYVNDSFGHPAGDELLKMVAVRLAGKLRPEDTLARFGGDEFMVLLPVLEHEEDAGRLASDIIHELNQPLLLPNNNEVRIGISIGIAIYPEHGAAGAMLLQNADAALYRAKEQGRGRFAYYSDDLTQYARTRIEMESKLRNALVEQQFVVYFQPQTDVQTGAIMGAEALVRWLSPEQGLVAPGVFIPIAEDTGLISAIGEVVLRQTCVQGAAWLAAGLPPLKLAVNLSSHQFSHGDIAATVQQILDETGFPAHLLELELTESAIMANENSAFATMLTLHQLGIQLAIDDFGTGYSSFSYLKKYRLDVLKIDKSFIDDVPLDNESNEIVSAIISMARVLKLKTLAEGVEEPEQLEFLRTHGCDYYQGYYCSKPLPAAEFELLLRSRL
ncbi:EAL domain-containing protein [Rheinheimera sp.]|uniref:EAL domain-containing protein n=1 Tax=Rheinheimera sp. TaxID=1869214 RepID=UPI0027B9DC93|nr:EAL domain-containing protein [Rheinheimera sp.]